jgi:hypothetical protein
MVALIGLVVLAAFLWASWVLMRSVAALSGRWQWGSAALLVLLIFLEWVQWDTGYALAIPMAPILTLVFGFVAYVLSMFLLWHKNRLAALIGLAVPLFFFFRLGRGLIIVLLVIAGTSGLMPDHWGRISPTLSYQTAPTHALIGGAAFEQYRIYRNPRGLPLMQKRIRNGSLPCPSATFGPGRDEQTIQITCVNGLGTTQTTAAQLP